MSSNAKNAEKKPLTQVEQLTKPKITPLYQVNRDVLTHEVVIKQTGYEAVDKSIPSGIRRWWAHQSFLHIFIGLIPILQWLPKYSIKTSLVGDIIAGFTVAIMNIPHGIAYGILAGVGPGSGLYMAIFPVLVYMIFGTSRHISIGTFAVISMMTLKVVQTYATDESDVALSDHDVITPLQIVTTLAFTTGLVHLLMALFGLGTLSSLLSDPLVSGFTTGAAVHVATSQLKEVFGITVPRYKGAFKIIYTLIDLGKGLPNTNYIAASFCLSIIIFMTITNEVVKPCLRKYCRLPLPAELIAIIGGTLISMALNMHEIYEVKLVGNIPKGLPMPELPRMDLISTMLVDSIAIAFVSYSVIMSMGLTLARKHNYEMRANQELFAVGLSNLVGGCFSCIPTACSLSRSVIQEQTGGTSQIASLVSALLIIATLLWIGPFFSALPRCVLAGVILVALKPMFMQVKELRKFSKQGKLECLTWLATFFAVVLIDIDYGLLIGVAISLVTLYIKGLKPYSTKLGYLPTAPAIYVDLQQHNNAMEIPNVKIFRYYSALNFATSLFFRRALNEKLFADAERNSKKLITTKTETIPEAVVLMENNSPTSNEKTNNFKFLIIDLSMLGHVDFAGCATLSDIMKEMKNRSVHLILAAPTDRVYDTLVHSMALGEGPFEIFPTLHDAVSFANAYRV